MLNSIVMWVVDMGKATVLPSWRRSRKNTPTQNTDIRYGPAIGFALFKLFFVQPEVVITGREISLKSNKYISSLTHDVGGGNDAVFSSFSACFLPLYFLG
jgi:hypothetical protein